jgi:hypothetical protein
MLVREFEFGGFGFYARVSSRLHQRNAGKSTAEGTCPERHPHFTVDLFSRFVPLGPTFC